MARADDFGLRGFVTERYSVLRGGGAEAQRVALTDANAYCTRQGRFFVPITMGQVAHLNGADGPTGYSLTFKCLPSSDTAVAKYRLERSPDLVIEQRNRPKIVALISHQQETACASIDIGTSGASLGWAIDEPSDGSAPMPWKLSR